VRRFLNHQVLAENRLRVKRTVVRGVTALLLLVVVVVRGEVGGGRLLEKPPLVSEPPPVSVAAAFRPKEPAWR